MLPRSLTENQREVEWVWLRLFSSPTPSTKLKQSCSPMPKDLFLVFFISSILPHLSRLSLNLWLLEYNPTNHEPIIFPSWVVCCQVFSISAMKLTNIINWYQEVRSLLWQAWPCGSLNLWNWFTGEMRKTWEQAKETLEYRKQRLISYYSSSLGN